MKYVMTELSCSDCTKLHIQISEKNAEIEKLTFQIQNLTKSLQLFEGRSCHKCYCSKEIEAEPYEVCDSNDKEKASETLFSLNKDTEVVSNREVSNEKDDSKKVHDTEANLQSTEEYVYDKNYKMYYCVSSGYYYDRDSGLYYVPQNGAFYTYDYSKGAYILYEGLAKLPDINKNENTSPISEINDMNKEHENESSKADDSCESVVDQVNNLNLNDADCTASSIVANRVVTESHKNETESDLSNVWKTPEGSNQTVQDLVRECAEQNSGISDYVYDEKYQMYYSASTGYYYDAVRKLLYDPQSGIYYKYDEDTSSYDFYYQVDLNALQTEEKSKEATKKVKARRRYWRKKLVVAEEKCSSPPKHSLKIEEKCSSSQKHSIKINNNEENYSSPEEGELFSSESDEEMEKKPEGQIHLENSADNYSPCIRAIVKESSKFKIGTLILITCSGAIIGRDKTNDVCIPEIGVSKAHAEVLFNNELWKYVIKDLGSQNGTFVNDSRLSETKEISSPCVLNHGDIVSVGSCKLLFHIHVGHETCHECEPGQVMAENPSNEEKLTLVFKTKEEKETERRLEVKRLKKKYGLEGMGYENAKNSVLPSSYEDKAEVRRKTVGSENPHEKTEASSLERSMEESNKGYQMLKKLGWKEGDSLGVTGLGISEPIPLRPWLSKAGLGSSEEQQASMLNIAEDKRNKKWVLAQERYLKLT